MRVFHYMSGEEVVIGDYVREIGCRDGRVVQIIQPDSEDAEILDCPEGGVVTAMDMSGTIGRAVWEPPDGDCWEDLEFIRRGSL